MLKNNQNPAGVNMELATGNYLAVAEVHDDVLVLKDGGLRSVVEVFAVNFDLKSEQEQEAIIYAYQTFLNALEFPVQILIRSRRVDIGDYLAKIQNKSQRQVNRLLKLQTEDYIEYVRKLVEYADIMEKRFYVVVPYDMGLNDLVQQGILKQFWSNINQPDSVQKYITRRKGFLTARKSLLERTNTIVSNLENMGVKTGILRTRDLVELMYETYNPESSRTQKIDDLVRHWHREEQENVGVEMAEK